MQHECHFLRRKSGLTAISSNLHIEKEAPTKVCISASNTDSKCARRAPDNLHDFNCRIEDSKKRCCSKVYDACDITNDCFLSNTNLLTSFNFCSPFLTEGKGTEAWRDFLWSYDQDTSRLKINLKLSCVWFWWFIWSSYFGVVDRKCTIIGGTHQSQPE